VPGVTGEVHHGHAAAADLALDPVGAEAVTWREPFLPDDMRDERDTTSEADCVRKVSARSAAQAAARRPAGAQDLWRTAR
jgi:hypothetical protein